MGISLGVWLARARQSEAPPVPGGVVKPEARRTADEVGTCVEELSALYLEQELRGQEHEADEQLVRDLEGLLEQSGLLAEGGTPMEWPTDLPDHLGPTGFDDTVKELQRACPEVIPANARIDCSEFPCALTWLREAPIDLRDYNLGKQCPAIAERRDEIHGNPQRINEKDGVHFMRLEFWPESMDPMMREWRGNRQRRSWSRLEPHYSEIVEEAFQTRCTEEGRAPACEMIADAAHVGGDRPARIAWMNAACNLGSASACEFIEELQPSERPD